jgi:subtilisin family serine protease
MSRRLGTLTMNKSFAGRLARALATVAVAFLVLAFAPAGPAAARPGGAATGASWAPGHVLLAFKPGTAPARRLRIAHAVGGHGLRRLGGWMKSPGPRPSRAREPEPMLLYVAPTSTLQAVSQLRQYRDVAYAEPDYLIEADAVPNDPFFLQQWGDENFGQAVPSQEMPMENLGSPVNGTPGADDGALEAWGGTTGSRSIVVGEVDTGVEYTHPDLGANIWSNPGGLGTCGKGTRGFNLQHEQELPPGNLCDPMDKDATYNGHGTHVAGIIGAVGGNNQGVAGMNWQTTILPVKWLQSAEPGSETSKLVEALKVLVELRRAGVNLRVVNDSSTYQSSENSQALVEQIRQLGELNVLFVTAAGNAGQNIDSPNHWYPCSDRLPNAICVTSTDNHDELPAWANWGPGTVDLAAPGASIYSTQRGGGYRYLSGGSMAAAQVSGAAALILSAQPSLTATELRARILGGVDVLPSLAGRVITGGRLDVCQALPGCVDEAAPAPTGAPPPPGPAPLPPPPAPFAPAISSLKLSPPAFKAARSGRAIVAATLRFGSKVSYTDSQPAVTKFTVLAPRRGVVGSHGACLRRPAHRQHRHYKACTRYVPVGGTFTHTDRVGRNSFRFSGHLPRLRLLPGSYVLRAVPTLAGRTGSATYARFRIVR